jgi:polysaccharide export outer membrane protein
VCGLDSQFQPKKDLDLQVITRLVVLSVCGCLLVSCAAPIVEKTLPVVGTSSAVGKNYRLSPNDVVKISVFQEPDMVSEQQIARDGSVSFPLIGRVVIGGLSMGEAEKTIAARLKESYLVNPQVSVVVTQYATQNYTILGQVGAPNKYPIPYDAVAFTLPMAVAQAGGNTRIGNLRNVRVTRFHGKAMTQYTVNMLSTQGQQFIIQPGDLITVQETLF